MTIRGRFVLLTLTTAFVAFLTYAHFKRDTYSLYALKRGIYTTKLKNDTRHYELRPQTLTINLTEANNSRQDDRGAHLTTEKTTSTTEMEDSLPLQDPSATTDISALIKELGIARSKWMDQPILTPFPYTFAHNPAKACFNKSVELLIAVPVSRSRFEHRQAVRQTWGSYAEDPVNKAVLLFFLGSLRKNEPAEVQARIDNESARYNDIVQSNFVDTYRNMSVKTVSILNWVDSYCRHADFLTKADDDVYVVFPTLVDQLRKTRRGHLAWRFIFGFEMAKLGPNRDKSSKWYASVQEYAERNYPTFTSGTSYSMPVKAARLLLQAALRTPFFWLEDVYVTGLSARKAGVSVVNNPLQTNGKYTPDGCTFRKKSIGHFLTPREMRNIHKELQNKNLTCVF